MSLDSLFNDYEKHRGSKTVNWIEDYPEDIEALLSKFNRDAVTKSVAVVVRAFLSGEDSVPLSASRLNSYLKAHGMEELDARNKSMVIATLGHIGDIDKGGARTKPWTFVCTDPVLIAFRKRLDAGERRKPAPVIPKGFAPKKY